MNRVSVLVIFLLVIAAVAYVGWRLMRADAEHACVASIQKGLHTLTAEQVGLGVAVGPEWRMLDDRDAERLVSSASQVNSLDCPRRTATGIPVDTWGGHFKLAVRRSPSSNNLEFFVRSDGPDRLPHTSDDISSPPGINIPAR